MKILNSTQNSLSYWISSSGNADCGSLDPGQVTDLSTYDNQANVDVSFLALPSEQGVTPFSLTIPSSGTGMAVTIGLYQE